ncbi:MAG: metallophosphoesterase [Ignavibacteriae bacterium]|nr:metallophosphoesterase [Ignavibacteriota bacterium]
MKSSSFIIFISIVLTIYGFGNFYVFYHGLQSLSNYGWLKTVYIPVFLFFSISYIAARVLQSYQHNGISDFFLLTGSFWLAALLYFFLICIGLDILRGIHHFVNIYPSYITFNYEKSKMVFFFASIVLVSSLLIYGYINAKNPVLNKIDLTFNKENSKSTTINAVVVSDIHLGPLSCGKWFDEVVERINALNPDVILLAGDVIDEDIKPVIERNLGEHLLNLKAKYGVFAITGNHEFIGGVGPAVKYLQEHNITVLRDTSVLVNNQFYLIGRDDREIDRFSGKQRKPLDELMKEVDNKYPVIVLNHQPTKLDELVGKGIDLSISGHTHHGQFFPNNLITKMIYEVSRGLINKSGTWVFVSTGLGTWGPPIRIGNHPEIVNLIINNN